MRHEVGVIAALATALATPALAQRGLSVVVSLEIHSRAPLYSGRADQARVSSSYGSVPVFFHGSSPFVIVRVTNYTSRRVSLGRSGRSWTDDLDLKVEHTSQRSSEGRVVIRRAATRTALEAGANDFLTFELASEPGEALTPGRYRVNASLNSTALPAAVRTLPGNRLAREEEFDVRPIDSERALWDLYLYRAMRARNDEDLPAARKWAEAVLRMHPNSFAAAWELANHWLAQDNCPNALPYLERADTIIRTGADTFTHARNYSEISGIVATLLKRCQKPVKEEPLWLDGSQPPPALSDMVADAGVVIVAVHTGNQRLHPDTRPTSLVSTLHRFEIVEVIKSAPAPLKAGNAIEVEMFGGIVEFPTETHHARVQGEERLIPKRRYVLFLNYLPTRSVGNYVKAWGGAGEGIYDITGERVRPLNTTRREHRGKTVSEFLGELRQFK